MQSTRELVVEPIGLDVETLAKPMVWADIFGNDHPVELEIGMGKGTFLVGQAKARPEVNFFGVEYARWFWRYASDRLRRNECLNARTVRAEAGFFLREFISDGSLAGVHIYFPDPWPKKRHHKRRLIQAGFIGEIRRVLKMGGSVRIVTDHADYFSQIREVVAGSGLREKAYVPAGDGEMAGTNFERKYRKAGRPFYALTAVKIG